MAYQHTNGRGQTYILHEQMVKLMGNNKQQRIYYFASVQKDMPDVRVLDAVPEGWAVKEIANSGMLVLTCIDKAKKG